MVKQWKRNSYSYVLKCIADIKQIGLSSYDINIEEEDFFSMKEQWLIKSLEYLLLEITGYRDIDNNPMVYLKEEVVLDDQRIIDYYRLVSLA